MASSNYWKLKALLKKNRLIMKRNICSTICEFVFPIILMICILCVRSVFDLTKYEFYEHEVSVENYIKTRSSSATDKTNPEITLNATYLGMSILPPFQICSPMNSLHKARPLIATIGVPQYIKQQMISDSLLFQKIIMFSLTDESFKDFESVEKMNEYIEDPKYGEDDFPLICFGIFFEEKDNKYKYSLHYFESSRTDSPSDLPTMKRGAFDYFQSGPDLDSFEKYQKSGYVYFNKLINEYILKKETKNLNATLSYGIIPMQYIDFREDPFSSFVGYMVPSFIIIAYICPLCLYVYRMVGEKETRAKEGMKIMGLTEFTYFLSYFLQYLVISLIVCIFNAIILGILFKKIPVLILFVIIFLWAMDVFAMCFFFQSFIDKTRVALILSLLIYFVMQFLSMACMSEDASKTLKVIMSVLPPVTIELGIILLGKFESHFKKFHLSYYFTTYTNYSIGAMNLMQLFDFFLFLFLGYYLQNVLPHEFGVRKPWYFLFTTEYWCGKTNHKTKNHKVSDINEIYSRKNSRKNTLSKSNKNVKNILIENEDNFESEEIYKTKTHPKDTLKVRGIVKSFSDMKRKAVDHVDINFYKDEIFALLGHNGAGKTTLISMLTGLYDATEGNAYYDNYDILDSNNMDKFRSQLGICPQHDVLFDDLSIREHLEMFCIFKGYTKGNLIEDVNKTLHDFELEDIQNITAKNLSAGQRRKLSIAISLVGGSEIIFLDEPSSGMDITSRRNLWEILKRQCEGRIIILTTHYMEEASVLGNRIGIINSGQMTCVGTPLFLIERFGKYMSLNIVKEENADNDQIVDFIQSKVKNVEYEILSEEIMFRIPKSNFSSGLAKVENKNLMSIKNKNVKKKMSEGSMILVNMFDALDNDLKKLKIKSYSASMPTLEDVFLYFAAEDNMKKKEENENNNNENINIKTSQELMIDNDKLLFETDFREDFKNKSKFINDFKACFHRRFLLTKRDIKGFLMEILCPILLIVIGLIVSKIDIRREAQPIEMNISAIGKQKILYAAKDIPNSNLEKYQVEKMENVTCENINIESENIDKTTLIQNFVSKIHEISNSTEDSEKNEVNTMAKNYEGYFGALLMLKNKNAQIEFISLINSRVRHGVSIYLNAFMNKILENAIGKKVEIEYSLEPMPVTFDVKKSQESNSSMLIVFFVAIAFSLIPGNFITIIVKEKVNNSKHLMRVSGINIFAYWLVNYIFELLKYYFTGGVCLLLLYAFDFYKEYLYILYLLYGPSMISLTYLSSFIFDSESSAQNCTILVNFILGALGSEVVLVFRGLDNVKKFGKMIMFILYLLPTFCFDFGYDLILSKLMIFVADYPNEWYFFSDNVLIKKFNLLLAPIIYMALETIIYSIILAIIESCSYTYSKVKNEKLESNINDSKVLKEIDLVNQAENSNKKEYAVLIKNLRKTFNIGNCCKKTKITAIKNINFCVEPGECFGLLGLNGAGKTSTFKCITQEFSPNNGKIYINGKDMSNNFNELSSIFGYCPQFDAIFEYMTVKENLEFYAKIKGVKSSYLQKVILAMIEEMSLGEFTNKIAGRLSGGNKRKLSVAISFLSNPQIVLLDEPSTGMDPEARRFMWSVIHKISANNSSVIMTTHSMDEAETLCKRMAIMVNGEFVCLGKANQIKEKYGYGYEVNVRIRPLSDRRFNKFLAYYNLEKNTKVDLYNINEILVKMNSKNFIKELSRYRTGAKIVRDIELNGSVSIANVVSWIFFVKCALKFIRASQNYFEEIILSEHIDNSFLFKMKKGNDTKSIGFFFGLFESNREDCHVTEYSIQQTSLEQIFNKFAEKQLNERIGKSKENSNVEKEIKSEIIVNEDLYNSLVENEE